MTRPSARAYAVGSSSVASKSPASGVVVTSMPRRRSPTAKARGQFSSRWKRIVLDIGGNPLPDLLQDGRLARPDRLCEPLAFDDIRVNPFAVLEVVCEGRIHIRERDAR